MNLRTSPLAALKQSRPCAFCGERIVIGTPATLVVRTYVFGKVFQYVHPTCSIGLAWGRCGRAYGHALTAANIPPTFTLYPADTPTSTFRMDSAFVRAGL